MFYSGHQNQVASCFFGLIEIYQKNPASKGGRNNFIEGNHLFSTHLSLFPGCFRRAEMAQAGKNLDWKDRRTNSGRTGEPATS